ncbi:MAG: glycoside hydrolase, partial [Bryobacteraceae bacterium]
MMRPLLLGLCSLSLLAQSVRPEQYNDMSWRHIGPFRGGRTVAASGIASEPNVFYIAANNGGVWKTDDYGHTWAPLFDNQPTGSIGALAIAPSNPKVIYVGSGEGLHRPDLSVGDGMYKSIDGGKSWKHLGLDDAQQIPAILVDPRNADRVYVAALGHPYGPNAERGVYRSDNGGATWTKILYKDENTGAIELAFAPDNPDIIYTSLWEAREGPWENGAWQGKNSGLFKSTDAGKTWTKLEKGLPTVAQGLGRIGLGTSPSNPSTLYAMVDADATLGGVYRSDDAGATWRKMNGEMRVWGRGSDFAWVRVHPKDKETIFVANTSAYKSTDGGKTFTAWKGAPGGDDYHTIWINPNNPETILLASDQGATITVNGGRTWSSWYNQPTAQFYHVITDDQWPYWVYGGQQESGSAGVKSRGDNGAITFRDWRTVGVEEYGYVAPDPLDANIIYGGKATRFDARTGQVQDISPNLLRDARYRSIRTMPLLFSPVDRHLLYLGANVVFQTANGGKSWDVISPDLTRESYALPASIGIFSSEAKNEANRRGVVYSIAPSHQDVNTIWAGTDDGLIHITHDGGKAWSNVTPSTLTPWSKVSQLDASHFDTRTAYAAVNTL